MIGCAFVTFCERQAAVDAQQALHEKKTLPGVRIVYSFLNEEQIITHSLPSCVRCTILCK